MAKVKKIEQWSETRGKYIFLIQKYEKVKKANISRGICGKVKYT